MSRLGKAGLFASVAMVFGLTGAAFGQQELNLREQGVRPYTIELKPLPTAITAVGNGTGSVGVGGEVFVTPKVAIFVDGQYTDLDMPNNLAKRAKDANQNEAVPDTMIGYSVMPGVRWYGNPALSSWYGAGAVGYSEARGKFKYQDTTVKSTAISVMPTLAAGYRWLFVNNVLVRVGAGASANIVQSHTESALTETANSRAGEKKVSDINKTPVLAAIDLGLGYAF